MGRGRRSRGWSFRFGTLHQSCACTHRHRIWFLSCLLSQQACDFILWRHQCLCFSRGMVPVLTVGLRASQFGTASEVPPGELPFHRHLLTYFSGGSKSTPPRRHFGLFVSRWNQTQVHAEGCPPSARCPRDARWVLGDRNSVQKEVDSATCNLGTFSEVLSRRVFYTLSSSVTFFHGHVQGRFSRTHAVTPHFTLALKQHRPQVRQEGGLPGTALPRDARSVHGDHGFDWNDVDFLLFGVTTEEIRWLQPRVVVPRVTHLPLGRRRHLRGHPPSLGSCVRRVRGIPCRPRRHPRCPRSSRRGRVPLVIRTHRSSPLLFKLKI